MKDFLTGTRVPDTNFWIWISEWISLSDLVMFPYFWKPIMLTLSIPYHVKLQKILKGCNILEIAVKWRSTYFPYEGLEAANRPENRCKSSADILPLSSRLPTIPSADCSKEFQSSKPDASTSSCRQPSQATYRRHNEWSFFGPRSHNSTPSLSAPRLNPSAGYKPS